MREEVWFGLGDPTKALLRSQHGPVASAPLTALTTSRATRIDAQPLRLLLCRTLRICQCGRLLDKFGHYRAACVEGSTGLPGGWGSRYHKHVRQGHGPR